MDVRALFLGPKGENKSFFKEMLQEAVDSNISWRKTFHPLDPYLFRTKESHDDHFRNTLYETEDVLIKLSQQLQEKSLPWFSPRYLGHMNSDTLMVANLAYVMTMLYNPNNCAEEASPITTQLEVDAGRDLCELFGYPRDQAWGHITSGGTVANLEGLWLARNLKALPLSIAAHPQAKHLVAGLSQQQLLNLPVRQTLDLISALEQQHIFEEVNNNSIRSTGLHNGQLGKVLIPRSKHYSWLKAMDILGLGQDQIVPIDVDHNYRIDIASLQKSVEELIQSGTPIMAVVTVVGTTEEGSVDPVHEVIALRDHFEQEHGISFYVHCDAAYGGYVRSMFVDEQAQFLPYNELIARYRQADLIPEGVQWPKPEVYAAFQAMDAVDSITVDPHKSGYIPYSAGAITYRDKRILRLLSYHAEYTTSAETNDIPLGPSILEGSKAGATAAAVWATHQVVPLNLSGYGPVIGAGIVTADWLSNKLKRLEFSCGERQFRTHLMMHPDYHMVNFGFKEVGNDCLKKYNILNQRFYEATSFISGRTFQKNFLTSSTSLSQAEHGGAPEAFVQQMGFSLEQWEQEGKVYVLRAAVMTQFLRDRQEFEEYWLAISQEFQHLITNILHQIDSPT
tara:strand:- start:687 stop:2549 length:1863 start_codon:yes stop_codon:yes gene_type:complete